MTVVLPRPQADPPARLVLSFLEKKGDLEKKELLEDDPRRALFLEGIARRRAIGKMRRHEGVFKVREIVRCRQALGDRAHYVFLDRFDCLLHYLFQHALLYTLHLGVDRDDGAEGGSVLVLPHDSHLRMHDLKLGSVPDSLAGGEKHVSFLAETGNHPLVETEPLQSHPSCAVVDPGVAKLPPARPGIGLPRVDNPPGNHGLFSFGDGLDRSHEPSVLVSDGYEIEEVFYYPHAPASKGLGSLGADAFHRGDRLQEPARRSAVLQPGAVGYSLAPRASARTFSSGFHRSVIAYCAQEG